MFPKNKVLSFWVNVSAIISSPPIYNNEVASIISPCSPLSIYIISDVLFWIVGIWISATFLTIGVEFILVLLIL